MLYCSKYEEICAPQVEEFCYITDNTYFKEEVYDLYSQNLLLSNFAVALRTMYYYAGLANGVCYFKLLEV